jgi:hypothetical protein
VAGLIYLQETQKANYDLLPQLSARQPCLVDLGHGPNRPDWLDQCFLRPTFQSSRTGMERTQFTIRIYSHSSNQPLSVNVKSPASIRLPFGFAR